MNKYYLSDKYVNTHLIKREKTITLSDFEKISLLGSGSFGDVYLVKHTKTDRIYAMKSLKKEYIEKKITRALTECEVLKESHHPFISTLHFCFQTELKLYIVMQYCAGGDFYNVIGRQPNKCLKESDARFYASCVLLALEYLHFNGVIYRDLKPENMLMHESGHIMLTDFDLSLRCSYDKVVHKFIEKPYSHKNGLYSEPNIKCNDQFGTPEYMAPEMVEGKVYTSIIDWWSFGIFIYEMLHGNPPFMGHTQWDTFKLISKCQLEMPNLTPNGCKISKKAKHLIKNLLERNPKNRLGFNGGATEIKDHPFFKKVEFQLLKNQIPPIIPELQNAFDHHYFDGYSPVANDLSDFNEDTSLVVHPKKLQDNDIWKVFCDIDSNSG